MTSSMSLAPDSILQLVYMKSSETNLILLNVFALNLLEVTQQMTPKSLFLCYWQHLHSRTLQICVRINLSFRMKYEL